VARTTTKQVVGAIVALLALVGCGGGEADERADVQDETTTTSAPATTTAGAADGTTTTTSTTAAPDGDETFGELVDDDLAGTEEGQTELERLGLALLVVPADLVGQSFVDAGYVPEEGPNGCGIDVDADHPSSVLVGTGLVDADGRSIVEELRVYPDVAAAQAAYEVHRTALGCGTDGAGTTFGPAVDVNDVVGADAAEEVAVVVEDAQGVVVVALVGDAVLTFATSAPAATPATLDPRELAAFGVGKVLAALEAA
jgi:hypothetical protein